MSYNTEGSGVGFPGEPPVANQAIDDESGEFFYQTALAKQLVLAASRLGARITFKFQLCEQTAVVWQAVLLKETLYLKPGDTLPDGSKEAFVALLEYTEEYLKCKQIFVCLKKNLVDRAAMVRTFMFLGFEVVSPNHPGAPQDSNYLALLYTIEDEDFDEDF